MELSAFTSFETISKATLVPFCSKQVLCVSTVRCRNIGFRRCRNSKSFAGITMCSDEDSLSNDYGVRQSLGTKSGVIDVIGIGSRKDAVLDFCMKSPFQLSSLRYWNVLMKDSLEVQLQLRSNEEESLPRIVPAPLFMKSCSTAIILVASAGYGSDHSVAVDIFKTIKSSNGLTVAIVLKPFVFEGLRRRDEVKNLVEKLKENTDLLIEIDIDSLLKKDLVTLDEAMKTANDAVLLAINAISVLKSEMHRKLIDGLHSGMKEVSISEINKIFESYKEAKIGFGAAYNMKTSILQSLFDCPFLGVSLKDSNSMVICNLTSSVLINDNDIATFLRIFRQTTEHKREIIISTDHEPNLEPNLLITTVLTLGIDMQQSSPSGGMISRLAQHFPFLFNFWGKHQHQPADTRRENTTENISPSQVTELYEFNDGADRISSDVINDKFNTDFESLEPQVISEITKSNASRCSGQNNEEPSDKSLEFSSVYDEITRGDSACPREKLINWNLGPGFEVAQEWAKERAADTTTPRADNVSVFNLPVGVRSSEQLKNCLEVSMAQEDPATENDVNVRNKSMPWSVLTDAGLEAVMDFTSTVLNGKYTDKSNKQGVLSVRAASMLEAERDSSKKWIPIVEMQYRGGQCKGRCQGGRPEGKGRLVLEDGSIYDGTWRYGKRSGSGTFYFVNGDVFQGSWRDDLMHGKGWFYFHTGDRWFANFWKGKANGEGRFYSKNGDAFFGNFKDGWRHGQFLRIDANGKRYVEIWEHGVILESKHLDRGDGEE